MEARHLCGREVITIDEVEITDDNILDIVTEIMNTHTKNRSEIDYLWKYYKGEQPIISRTKESRPDICNRIVENRANEIVSFKVGYLCGEPIQYIGRNADESVSKGIAELNEMMFVESKATRDKEIAEWQSVCGTAYRLVLPAKEKDEDKAPFELYTLDPRDTFVAYSNEVGGKPLLGGKCSVTSSNDKIFSVYSHNHYWRIKNDKIEESKPNPLGAVNIVEYPANTARLGAFEPVLDLLDEINNIASNRMDGIEQFVQAFIKFINCDITEESFKEFLELGAIKVKSLDGNNADVDMVCNELNQAQVQVAKDDAHSAIVEIVGMPSMSNGSTSDSSNNGAVILKNGWQGAETRAKDAELMFKGAEREIVKLVLRIIKNTRGLSEELYNLKLKDIEFQFTRRNYENIQSKAQVLTTLLASGKVHPRLAFSHCGMFTDPEDAYRISEEYAKANAPKIENDPEGEPVEGDEPKEGEEQDK